MSAPRPQAAGTPPAGGEAGRAERPLAGVRVLLAEDSAANRRFIAFCLERAGASVTAVEDGRQLVQALTVGGPDREALADPSPADLVLTDVEMPGMDGYAATRLLRGLGCALPIVALTARTDPGEAERCLAAGCDAHGAKPVDPAKLLALCVQILGRAAGGDAPDGGPPAAGAAAPLRSELADDPEMRELVREFVAGLAEHAQALRASFEANRLDELASRAHQLKGAGASFGFRPITDTAREVEARARGAADRAALGEALERLIALCHAALAT
ncbi:MAG TPA: response regulator [Gammaproteobacteria bacterium]